MEDQRRQQQNESGEASSSTTTSNISSSFCPSMPNIALIKQEPITTSDDNNNDNDSNTVTATSFPSWSTYRTLFQSPHQQAMLLRG